MTKRQWEFIWECSKKDTHAVILNPTKELHFNITIQPSKAGVDMVWIDIVEWGDGDSVEYSRCGHFDRFALMNEINSKYLREFWDHENKNDE